MRSVIDHEIDWLVTECAVADLVESPRVRLVSLPMGFDAIRQSSAVYVLAEVRIVFSPLDIDPHMFGGLEKLEPEGDAPTIEEAQLDDVAPGRRRILAEEIEVFLNKASILVERKAVLPGSDGGIRHLTPHNRKAKIVDLEVTVVFGPTKLGDIQWRRYLGVCHDVARWAAAQPRRAGIRGVSPRHLCMGDWVGKALRW